LRFFLALLLILALPVPASARYFGKNKVQYRNQEWRVLETRHFEIYFYAREAAIVHDAARLAERSYTRIARTLRHDLGGRVPLILYTSHSDFQQTHITPAMIDIGTGGVTELARRRVFLPFTGSFADFEHVLTHELVHAFELDILFDPKQTDPLNPFAYAPPLWVMEGLAEYLARPKRDTHTNMWLRDAALSGHLLSVEELELVRDIRVYRFGQSIFEYFASKHGDQGIGDLLRALRDHRDLDAALETVAGVSLREFSQGWTTRVRREHLPTLAKHQEPREFSTAVVTRESEDASMLLVPSISPNGRWLAYVSDKGITRDLYLRDLERLDGSPHRLVRGNMSGEFESLRFFNAGTAWSPDSRRIAFVAQASGEDALYLLDVEARKRVAKHRFGMDELQTPTFSPDGDELVFVGQTQGRSNLYRVNVDGTRLQPLTSDRYAARDPQWSPDGRYIVYVTDEGGVTNLERLKLGRLHLMLLDLESGERRDITPFATGKAVSPVWSGDGEYIAFLSDVDGVSNVYMLHLPTNAVFRLTDSVTGVGGILPSSPALSWARDTNRIVFSAFNRAGWDIYRIDNPQARMRPLSPEVGTGPAVVASVSSRHVASEEGCDLGRALGDSSLVQRADHPLYLAPRTASESTTDLSAADSTTIRPAVDLLSDSDIDLDFKERAYKPRLAPDLSQVGGVVGYDTGIGGASAIHFSDLLGNHKLSIGLGIYGSLQDSDLSFGYLNRAGRTSYELSAFQFQRRYGFLMQRSDAVEKQTFRGVRGKLMRPFDKFSRLETSLQVAGVRGRFFLGQTAAEAQEDSRIDGVRAFVGPGVAYVVDTAIYGSTGPIMGRRMRLSLESGFGQLEFATLEADVRQYWSLSPNYSVAARLFAAASAGATPQTFYLGGSYTLRGYNYGALVGNRAALASLEFRFPVLRYVAFGWPLPLELHNVRGVLFVDAASAWDQDFARTARSIQGETVGRRPQVSAGFGTRLNLGAFVLKLDWAQRWDTGVGRVTPGANVSVGADF
jgi:Tol biopolymer transport system component